MLPPHPPYSQSVIQPNPHLHPSVKQPGIQRSVISPTILVEEASLDWDNYSDSPSYNPSVQQLGNQANLLNTTSCIREVQGISGLVEAKKITLVSTSEISLSSPGENMSYIQNPSQDSQNLMAAQMRQAAIDLEDMKVDIEEMLEDTKAADVREVNVHVFERRLERISDARMEFKKKVREYKRSYQLTPSSIEWLDNSVSLINQLVDEHARLIWAKVEEIKIGQTSSQAPPALTSQQASNNFPSPSVDGQRKVSSPIRQRRVSPKTELDS